jgi:hypothetical protein
MPNLDGTGPNCTGPRTGRGLGNCGCRRGRFISPKNEMSTLENEEKMLEEELAEIRKEKAALKNDEK